MKISQTGMPRGYTLHYDHQLGYWWSKDKPLPASVSKCYSCPAAAKFFAREDRKMSTPRVRGLVCGKLWVCYLHDRVCTGMTPEQAYSNWLSFYAGYKP